MTTPDPLALENDRLRRDVRLLADQVERLLHLPGPALVRDRDGHSHRLAWPPASRQAREEAARVLRRVMREV
jgi:hypothetical protein